VYSAWSCVMPGQLGSWALLVWTDDRSGVAFDAQSPEKHQAATGAEEGGDTNWCLRSFLDNPFKGNRKGNQPDWHEADPAERPGSGGAFGPPKALPGVKADDAGVRPRVDTGLPASAAKPRRCPPPRIVQEEVLQHTVY
jgi:hypothetical protein